MSDAMSEVLGRTLPTVNAVLNALCAVLLIAGRRAIVQRRDRVVHRALMLSAFTCSAVFLASYTARILLTGTHRFPDLGLWRAGYIALLGSHTVLAAVLVPLVLRTLWLALRERFEAHRGIARVTWWIWLYVSVTGVLVYAMLYHVAPALQASPG